MQYRDDLVRLPERPLAAAALLTALMMLMMMTNACAHRSLDVVVFSAKREGPGAMVPVVQEGHASAVKALAIDPSGTLVVTAANHELRLWEVTSGQLRARLDSTGGPIRDVAFTWSDRFEDGEFEAMSVAYTDDHGLKVWSLVNDKVTEIARHATRVSIGNAGEIGAVHPGGLLYGVTNTDRMYITPDGQLPVPDLRNFPGDAGPIRALDLAMWRSPGRNCYGGCATQRRAVLAHEDGQLVVLNLNSGRNSNIWVRQPDPCGAGPIKALPTRVALSPDGSRVAAAYPGRILVWTLRAGWNKGAWDLRRQRPYRSTCLRAQDTLLDTAALQFGQGDDTLQIVGKDGSLRAWDLQGDRMRVVVPQLIAGAKYGKAAHSVTRHWLAFEHAGRVVVRDMRSGAPVADFRVTGRGREITEIAFSANGQLAVGREDRVEVWDLASGTLRCHDALADRVAWSPVGYRLAAWAAKGSRVIIRATDPADDRPDVALAVDDTWGSSPLAWADDDHVLVSEGATLTVWDPDTGQRLASIDLRDNEAASVLSLDAAGGKFAAILQGPRHRLMAGSLTDPAAVLSVLVPPPSGPVAITDDGTQIATTHGPHPATLWDTSTLRAIDVDVRPAPSELDHFVALAADVRVIGTQDGAQVSLQVDGERSAAELIPVRGRPLAGAVSVDGKLAAVATGDGIDLYRLGRGAHRAGARLVSAGGEPCEGLAVYDRSRIVASVGSRILVRLGSPLSGALVPADKLPSRLRDDGLLQRFVALEPMRKLAHEAGSPELHRTMSRGRHLLLDITDRGSALVCVTVEFADGERTRERCVDTVPHSQNFSIPAAPIASVWVRACDASRTLCSRRTRVTPLHWAIGRRVGG